MNPSKITNHTKKLFSRRNFLTLGLGLMTTELLTTFITFPPVAHAGGGKHSGVNKTKLNPEQALQKLMQGNRRFVRRKRHFYHQSLRRVKQISQGQAPFACILGCADSRVPPEIIFDQGLGDIFVVRVAGNVATPEEIASEEYATFLLGAKVLMVLGHERCGAVTAALENEKLPDSSLGSLINSIRPAIDSSKNQPGDPLTNAIKANIKLQVERLKNSVILTQLLEKGQLKIVGAYYDLDTGKVSLL